jgi:hypothetical protein
MRSSRSSRAIPDLDLPDLGWLAFDASDLSFEVLSFDAFGFEDLAFGIVLVRRSAGARFADFRPRLAMFPPVEL